MIHTKPYSYCTVNHLISAFCVKVITNNMAAAVNFFKQLVTSCNCDPSKVNLFSSCFYPKQITAYLCIMRIILLNGSCRGTYGN